VPSRAGEDKGRRAVRQAAADAVAEPVAGRGLPTRRKIDHPAVIRTLLDAAW